MTITPALHRKIELFLYAEALALEDNRLDDWLEYFDDDVHYWMPVRETIEGRSEDAASADTFSLFDDDKSSLQLRVLRIKTGNAHAEVPLSVTQRLITNIIPLPGAEVDMFNVRSTFMVYQERRGLHGTTFFGARQDVLRAKTGTLRIARRKIELAQAVLPTTVSIFF